MVLDHHENGTKLFDRQLLDYIKTGYNERTRDTLKNVDIKELIDSSGKSLLHWSSAFVNLEMIKYFVENQCNIDAQDNDGNTSLMLAVEAGEEYSIEALLKAGANVYISNKKSECPMGVVLSSWITPGRRIVKLFLGRLQDDCGVDKETLVNKLMDFECPVYLAVLLRDAEVTSMMLDRGCWIEARCPKVYNTALHEAVAQSDLENVKLLVDRGLSINYINYRRETPLCRYNIWTKDSEEKIEILKFLIAKGAEIYCKKSPLERLFKEGKKKTVCTLLQIEGFNFRMKFSEDRTALHLICMNENPGMAGVLDLFRGKNFDINAVDEDGMNALMIAANRGCVKKVECLLKMAASPLGNYRLRNPLYEASNPENYWTSEAPENYRRIVDLLLQHGAALRLRREVTFLEEVTMKRHFDVAESFLARLAQMKVLDEYRVDCYTLEEIRRVEKHEAYFTLCIKSLEEMKNFAVHESIVLLQLLTESQRQVNFYARNDEFVSKFNNTVIKKLESIPCYYSRIIQRRVTAAVKKAKKGKAVSIIRKIFGLTIDKCYIAYEIVNYLDDQDMKNLIDSVQTQDV